MVGGRRRAGVKEGERERSLCAAPRPQHGPSAIPRNTQPQARVPQPQKPPSSPQGRPQTRSGSLDPLCRASVRRCKEGERERSLCAAPRPQHGPSAIPRNTQPQARVPQPTEAALLASGSSTFTPNSLGAFLASTPFYDRAAPRPQLCTSALGSARRAEVGGLMKRGKSPCHASHGLTPPSASSRQLRYPTQPAASGSRASRLQFSLNLNPNISVSM